MRDYEFYYTQDGSVGLYSYADDDVYHSKFGALTEAWEKFILPADIDSKLNKQSDIRILDVCYGIGYNTKALMSYVINSNEKIFKRKNPLKKFLKKIKFTLNTDSIGNNNILQGFRKLLNSTESINDNNFSSLYIDCLEINDELVKISPFLKTILTPQEVYTKIVPQIFTCFDTYWKIKKFLAKITPFFAPKNKKEISELLELKFNNDYDELKQEYKLHKFVNYIIADALLDYYKEDFFNEEFKKKCLGKSKRKFFDKSMLEYAQFKQNYRYKLLSKLNLFAFLHNIYYDYLSKRNKKIKFKHISKLFKLNFHVKDARKTILELNGEYDYVFLDAFTYSKAPELWTVEFMAEIYKHLADSGIIMTYSNSALVRNTFLENNFYVGKILDEKTGKFIGTVASKDKNLIKYPLSNYEIGLCGTKAGIPYHDPSLNLDKKEILKRREREFNESELMSSSMYMKTRKQRSEANEE
ncbi:MAG: MnmC family methyltransferase [Candidatus Gastranaerophilales bacterium]|nr:MnmC family methyltransferase [Candidatus Gastranaerophilales bacterium]MCM1073583.1 MnmC family methyltransferase [Bacteroides sp.]